ncbi:MAG: type II pantothenate kinase [Clostridia bacterium]|nr:type II pantothenate kinase [Clostridia bacterium]MBQ3939449.1 type II pantothenate kinase [Clostridia bacterium]
MGIILGIDVGGSTTKIVGLRSDGSLISTMMVRAYDQITSLYGALGHYINDNRISLGDVEDIFVTGVGSSYLTGDIYGIPTHRIDEFSAIARGGLALAKVDEAIVVSMGTGTAFVSAGPDGYSHIGGSGVGGGLLLGLGKKLANASDFESLCSIAATGNLSNVDLTVGDISKSDIEKLSSEMTAANLANIKDGATDGDLALGLINMVLQTILTLASFACRDSGINSVILTGSLTELQWLEPLVEWFRSMSSVNYIIPPDAAFATAVGAALHCKDVK